jgi:hypothetical protein
MIVIFAIYGAMDDVTATDDIYIRSMLLQQLTTTTTFIADCCAAQQRTTIWTSRATLYIIGAGLAVLLSVPKWTFLLCYCCYVGATCCC